LKGLEALDLSGCSRVTDAGIRDLEGLTGLRSLLLCGCEQITDRGIALLSTLTGLQRLDLTDCAKITDAGLLRLRKLKSLKRLTLDGCAQCTNTGLEDLKEALPSCTVCCLQEEEIRKTTPRGQPGGSKPDTARLYLEVNVVGTWYTRPSDDPEANWSFLAEGPDEIPVRFGEDYRLDLIAATDRELSGLAKLGEVICLREVNVNADIEDAFSDITDTGLSYLSGVASLQKLTLLTPA
jgi:Leucine Rich repeat